MMQTIKGTASRNVIFGGITYVLAEDIYYDAKDWAPIEPRAQGSILSTARAARGRAMHRMSMG